MHCDWSFDPLSSWRIGCNFARSGLKMFLPGFPPTEAAALLQQIPQRLISWWGTADSSRCRHQSGWLLTLQALPLTATAGACRAGACFLGPQIHNSSDLYSIWSLVVYHEIVPFCCAYARSHGGR